MGQWKKHYRLKKRQKVSVRKEKSCLSMWILSEITKHDWEEISEDDSFKLSEDMYYDSTWKTILKWEYVKGTCFHRFRIDIGYWGERK